MFTNIWSYLKFACEGRFAQLQFLLIFLLRSSSFFNRYDVNESYCHSERLSLKSTNSNQQKEEIAHTLIPGADLISSCQWILKNQSSSFVPVNEDCISTLLKEMIRELVVSLYYSHECSVFDPTKFLVRSKNETFVRIT